ncbi:MAG: sodium ion-translocating decarboxylase subunit beta [Planctomycetes bacterium]|nr:sodium ion-translocating decarboxylase subunit beta [Planctomycetota bacterium]
MSVDNQCRALGLPLPRVQLKAESSVSIGESLQKIANSSGLAKLTGGNYIMIGIGLLLLWLAIVKGFEPLLLVPIAGGCIFVNAAGAGMGDAGGLLFYLYSYGIETSIFPLLIFMGVGALTDFGPLLANPWMALLGGAAQFGIFGCFVLAMLFGDFFGLTMQQAGAIAIIGGADGPTSIYVASKLAPELLGAIAVAAYSYMALVPMIQPPIMRLLTNDGERKIMMTQRRPVSKRAKIIFPIVVIVLCILTLPEAVPLIGMLMLGNLMKESGVVDRLSNTAQNELINLVTIGLGLSVGMKMSAAQFLDVKTMGILALGIVAFIMGTAAGVIMAKILNKLTGGAINPLIGSAGVSAVPMAARVSQNEGAKYNKSNFLLMHAMGPNVAGVIGSAVAAGILLSLLK